MSGPVPTQRRKSHVRYDDDEDIDNDTDDFFRFQDPNASNSRFYPLIDYVHLPPWLKDNKFIFKGYRINLGWRRSCDSACHIHNETVNVWTHLLAFIVITFLLIITLRSSPFGVDRLNIGVFVSNHTSSLNICPTDNQFAANVFCSPTSSSTTSLSPAASSSSTSSISMPSSESFQALFDQVRQAVPTLEQVTSTLLEKTHSLSELVDKAGPAWPSIERTRSALIEYVSSVEMKLEQIKETMLEMKDSTSRQFSEQFTETHAKFMQQVDGFSALTQTTKNDLLSSAKLLLNDFYNTLDQLPPTIRLGQQDKKDSQVHDDVNTDNTMDESLMHIRIIPLPSHPEDSDAAVLVSNKNHSRYDDEAMDQSSSYLHPSLSFLDSLYIVDSGLHDYLARWPLAIFLFTAMCCLGFSAFFHLFQSVSKRMCNALQCLDYAGICLLITGSNVPLIYYGFYCVPVFSYIYISICSALGLIGFSMSVLPRFRPVKYRLMKTSIFLCMGFFGVIPTVHLLLYFGHVHFIFWYLLAMGGSYLTGAAVYVFRVPECFFPGKFDYWFHSHQLWHVSIFVAVLTHYFGLVRFYEWRMQQVCS